MTDTDDFIGVQLTVDGIEYRYGISATETFNSNTARPILSFISDTFGCPACHYNGDYFKHRGYRMRCNREIDWDDYWTTGRIGDGKERWDIVD